MGTGLTILMLILVAAATLGIGLVVIYDVWTVEGRILWKLSALELLLAKRPSDVRRDCERLEGRLYRDAQKRRPSVNGMDAFPD